MFSKKLKSVNVVVLFFGLIGSFLSSIIFISAASAATLNFSIDCSASGPLASANQIHFNVNQGDTINFTNAGGTCAGFANANLYPAFTALSPSEIVFPNAIIQNFDANGGNLSVKVKDNANINGGNGVDREYRFIMTNSSRGAIFYMTINAVPRITSISPSQGPGAGGTSITITGTGFESTATVTVGGVACAIVNRGGATTWMTSTTITCNTPAGSAGPADVIVTDTVTNNLTATSVGGFTYLNPEPSFSSTTPTFPTTGVSATSASQNLMVTNSGDASLIFGASAVAISGTNAGDFAIGSDTCSSQTIAPSATCAVAVTFTPTATGTRTASLNFTDNASGSPHAVSLQGLGVLTVSSSSPLSGAVTGGMTITITGTGFVTGATVSVGGQECTNPVVQSATSITCTVPAGLALGASNVVVTNPEETPVTKTDGFTYISTPVISLISPTTGPAKGGTPITITGTGFISGATVTIGGVACDSVVVVSATEITCTTAAGTSGVQNVVITNPDSGSFTATGGFTNKAASSGTPIRIPMQTSSVTACGISSGPTTGGNSYTISGKFNSPVRSISVAGVPVSPANWSQTPSSVTITMPQHIQGVVSVQLYNEEIPGLIPCNYTYVASGASINSDKPLLHITKEKFYFALGSSKISKIEAAKLKSLAKKLAGLGTKITITVTGYAQPTPGSEKTDAALSKSRAAAVASLLRKAGVNTKITYAGAGRAKVNSASSRYVEIVADNK